MSTLTTIASSDLITNSRAVINNNFAALNTDKQEASGLSTDSTFAANSDVLYPSQKATKAYVDAGGNVNASTTTKGIVQEATSAQITSSTDTGSTGARLFVSPSKLNTQIVSQLPSQTYSIGSLANTVVKTYFNIQLFFNLWTGSVINDATTTFSNWSRSSSAVFVVPFGSMIDFQSTGSAYIDVESSWFNISASTAIAFQDARTYILDFFMKLPASATGDIGLGFGNTFLCYMSAYNSTTGDFAGFNMSSAGTLYATIRKNAVGVTNTNIASGITTTNWNNYRIEINTTTANFYVNGILKATLTGTNYPTTGAMQFGFGRSNTALFQVTAPNLSIQLI